MSIISKLKFNNDSDLFALEKDGGLKEIIGAVYQSFDGNKRIAATLFIYFLEYYNILYKDDRQVIDNNTLVAITLLIAESNPKENNILIDLVMNFLDKSALYI